MNADRMFVRKYLENGHREDGRTEVSCEISGSDGWEKEDDNLLEFCAV
jgi:hypothetical protein